MGDIDERAGVAGEVILRSMMAQVGRDESIGTGRCRQEGIPSSPAHGDGLHCALGIASDAHAVMGLREPRGDMLGELLEGHGLGKLADAPGADTGRLPLELHERADDDEAKSLRQCVAHAWVCVIGIGVGGVQRDPVRDEPVHDPTLGIRGRYGVDPP